MFDRSPKRALSLLAGLLGLSLAAGCTTAEGTFTAGRLEDLCVADLLVCDTTASCVTDESDFVRLGFPGHHRVVWQTTRPRSRVRVRLFFSTMRDPGTELQVVVNTPDCGDADSEVLLDQDVFELAGDRRVLEFDLDANDSGDHLVEVFSDMTADVVMTTSFIGEGDV